MNNKVKFNICNCHYALQKLSEAGEITFDTPVAMPGAMSLALDPNGEPESFYADGIEYYIIANNMGYDGDLELALIPESFRTDVLKEEADTLRCWWRMPIRRRRLLPCCLSLTGISGRSGMCCITVPPAARRSKARPMKRAGRCRRKR